MVRRGSCLYKKIRLITNRCDAVHMDMVRRGSCLYKKIRLITNRCDAVHMVRCDAVHVVRRCSCSYKKIRLITKRCMCSDAMHCIALHAMLKPCQNAAEFEYSRMPIPSSSSGCEIAQLFVRHTLIHHADYERVGATRHHYPRDLMSTRTGGHVAPAFDMIMKHLKVNRPSV